MGELTDLEQRVLAFEHGRWRAQAAKDQAVLDEFGLSRVRYEQLLRDLLDEPAALAHDPMLVKRLRRLRATRQQVRQAG